jgi:23S rRNA (uracil1939-C5)-methyltransferase
MAIGDTFSAVVERLTLGGRGLVRLEGRSVFVSGTAAGDRIIGRITAEKNSWAEGELTGLIEASPQRVEPLCPVSGTCGGCQLQHLSYEAQLEAKKTILLDTLSRHIENLDRDSLPELNIIPSAPWEYRNRVSFHAIRSNKGPKVGFKAQKSSEIIPIPDCPVADPAIRSLLQSGGLIPPVDRDRFTLYGRGDLLLGAGRSRGEITLLDRTLTLDAECFFQSNAALLEKCAAELRFIAEGAPSPMADLYAGVGTFSVFLGDMFSSIDLVEENPKALELARHNLRARPRPPGAVPDTMVPDTVGREPVPDTKKVSGTMNRRFFPMTDERWVRRAKPGAYGFIVSDPPRQGLSPSMTQWLIEGGAPVLAYLSCEPASLARDCNKLLKVYTIKKLYLYDFYPQTAHIESLVVFERRKN